MTALILNLNSVIKLTTEQFYQLCEENPDLKLERNAQGELVIMPPTGGETGKTNSAINAQIWIWNNQTKSGEVFDSSTGFTLPNGADRSPDVSWVEKSRWGALTKEQKEKFIPLSPDFVIEILSPNDSLKKTQNKMQEYIENGCRLGWLINRKLQEVAIYRPGQDVEVLKLPQTLCGESVLPGFILNLQPVW
ncbi:Uma2 family endonuclease [Aetokthonos hydrillicola Thurmond2011]|jgi:Uma2 family endonuclease|uniref:Uma2 family endonuclease n=1 Tax=Aetokthonos hydrillicola Thurmond2011 TaxID=2712845 RepID=A0AAP5I5Q5_9CYAN|nr:Uma2 family endonuclease [Aetokthonos hydrillicola]MBO3459072.1 Uma2 family endonuclease [Aetokthonos hydrillicola CCALA 1050]MBW4584754.1 Uma2 family endonuclease [Aetokthonos hydrillicola CCALA 1050]MDR9895301.1 Uma2 family endonuclease [Aetokthonos hydrillicola Thurmond2011]